MSLPNRDRSRGIRLLVFFVLIGNGRFGELCAQDPQIAFHGKVLDSSESAIPGAKVTAILNGSRSEVSAISDGAGGFALRLQPGRYTLTIVATGFEPNTLSIDVRDSESAPQEFVLNVAAINSAVTVTDSLDYQMPIITTATKTPTALRDIPQSITVVTQQQVRDQTMLNVADVVRYVPGITAHQGENNRDQIIIRGNSSSADFFVNGVRDDVQYYRDLYNVERIEALKGPNAMMFGRGGGGGVINRVTKEAGFLPLREVSLLGGTYGDKRLTTDWDQPITDRLAFRLNGLYENSDSFRKHVNLERYAINPTVTFASGKDTMITFGYERFIDHRLADRGIPSFQGRPADVDVSTYFGDPDQSRVRAAVNLGYAAIEHQIGRLNVQNRSSFGDYDRGYQNFVPGAVSGDRTQVALSAYNNATQRLNIFNQTNLTYGLATGHVRHTLVAGAELGRQVTDNFRATGFFNNTSTSLVVSYSNPTIHVPVIFRQSATDANNHLNTTLAASYVQDQVDLSGRVHLIAGVRFDYFDLRYRNNRTNEDLRRIDNLVSPRAGIVFKPIASVSLYANYSVSFLPSSGDQFSSLTTITQQVKPEKFKNYEGGLKWDMHRDLSLTASVYRLDRRNSRSTDPNDPTRIVQTGSTRTNGFEFGLNGRLSRVWRIAGGYAYQDAFIATATTAAPAGNQVAQVPHHTFSFWNNYQILPALGAGVGLIHRSDMFAAVDNTVILPGYTRADAAVYFNVTEKTRFQVNVENVLNQAYYANADSNTNISPGSPRAVRVGLTTRF